MPTRGPTRISASLLALLLGVLAARGAPASDPAGPPFWKATGAEGTAYLLGSVHFGRRDMYPLPPAVERAFAETAALAVEIDVNRIDPAHLARRIAAHGVYAEGGLEERLRPETWRRLEGAAGRLGLSTRSLERQKPWLVSLTLTTLEFKRLGYREDLGIDRYFLDRAGAKEILELESLERQLEMFAALTAGEGDALLRETLRELERGDAYFESIVDAWKRGDGEALDGIINASLASAPDAHRTRRLLLDDRNVAMTAGIRRHLAGRRSLFVVVGAGHLVGRLGIVRLMREAGFRVSPVRPGPRA